MDISFYLKKFQEAADRLDKNILAEKKIDVAVGVFQKNSVFLKLYKKSWANESDDLLTVESRIFFSIWVNDSALKRQKIFYNIHALKLRELKGYSIESRKFADEFRRSFKSFEKKWKNVSTEFGPLTLMEGWVTIDVNNCMFKILKLSNRFLEIDHLIDDNLARFKK